VSPPEPSGASGASCLSWSCAARSAWIPRFPPCTAPCGRWRSPRDAALSSSRAIAACALFAACSRGSSRPAPVPTGVQPSAAYTSADVPLTISGRNFEPVASEQIGQGGGLQVDSTFRAFLGDVELDQVQWQGPD